MNHSSKSDEHKVAFGWTAAKPASWGGKIMKKQSRSEKTVCFYKDAHSYNCYVAHNANKTSVHQQTEERHREVMNRPVVLILDELKLQWISF